MLKRKAYSKLEQWFRAPTRKALLIKGARQVGKSYIAQEFARDHFENIVSFDLLLEPQTRESFSAASSPEDLLTRISIAATTPLVEGKTVIIIDEAQEAPNVVTQLKGLVARSDFAYILTGSLLGVKLENIDSLPVGYLTQLEMFPLDFEEYCWACGLGEELTDDARQCLADEAPIPDPLFARMTNLIHEYLLVGGMPDAVVSFLSSRNIDEARTVHADIHSLYRDDITKHAPKDLRLLIRDIYDLIPSEAGSRNKRFKLSSIADVKRYSQVSNHFLWLANAGVALPVVNVSAPVAPLLASEKRSLFKLFYLDVGMLASCYPKSQSAGVLDGKPEMNMGGIYEAAVAQQLKALGYALRYFTSKKVGELDFLVESANGNLTAIEVKSGSAYRTHAALDNALATKGYGIDKALVLAECNIERVGSILYAPVFAACFLDGYRVT